MHYCLALERLAIACKKFYHMLKLGITNLSSSNWSSHLQTLKGNKRLSDVLSGTILLLVLQHQLVLGAGTKHKQDQNFIKMQKASMLW